MYFKYFLLIILYTLLASCNTDTEIQTTDTTPCNCNDLYFDDLYGHFYLEEKNMPYTGICETFYKSNKQLKLHKEFKNGKVDGLLRIYYEEGTLKEESQFMTNFQHGYKKTYSPTGILINHSIFRKGELDKVVFPS